MSDPLRRGGDELLERLIPDEETRPSSVEDVPRLPSFLSALRKCEELLGSEYAALDRGTQDALTLRRLQQMTNTLMLNPVWRERLSDAGLKQAPETFEEWQQVPISDRVTATELFMGERAGLVVPLHEGGFELVASGGTSGGLSVESVYSLRELHDTYEIAGEFLGRHVLRPYLADEGPKWMITTLADYQLWSSGSMVGGVLQRVPGVNYIGAGPLRKEVYRQILSYPGPKAVMGISKWVASLAELGAGLHEEARNSLRVAMYGSGLVPQRKRSELEALYPKVEILSYFAATQAETIGLQRISGGYLCAVPGLHLIEIVDDAGRWVDEGEEGELVVTRLHAHEAPLPRYRIGDRMIRRPDLDLPGLRTQQFEFAGRSGDVIHLVDTQYSAPRTYAALCRGLSAVGALDLESAAHEIQFRNDRAAQELSLLALVDDADGLGARVGGVLGVEGLQRLFTEALVSSLSIFNRGEANAETIARTGYVFRLHFLGRETGEIHRTEVGKVPLIRDVF